MTEKKRRKGREHRKQKWRLGGPRLTPKQVEIMDLVKLGLVDKEIAYRLGVSTLTISNQLSNGVYSRLGAVNRASAVYICVKEGIIS